MPPKSENHHYTRVRKDEEDTEEMFHEEIPQKRALIHYWPYLTHGILLVLCALFMFLWLDSTRRNSWMIPYSPANVAIEYYKDILPFNGALNYSSPYRGPPTPEIDAAWIKVSTGVPPLRITREQLIRSGQAETPSKVKFREEDGGGYMASLEVTHQLHCLDILRKSVYLEYYSQIDPLFKSKPETYRFHLDHCIDILRQVLMCSADVGMITFEWVQGLVQSGFTGPYPNFNTKHQCRNFERVISWGITNAARVPSHRIIRIDGEIDLEQVP